MLEMFPMSGVNSPDEEHSNPFDLSNSNETESYTDTFTTPVDSSDSSENMAGDYDDSVDSTDSEHSFSTESFDDSHPRDQIGKLKSIVAKLAKGLNASSFPDFVQSWIPQLAGSLFPGSYAHLLVILLMDFGMVEGIQHNMQCWMADHFPALPSYRTSAVDGLDGGLFIWELRILRKMLAPLRGDNSSPIHWIESRIEDLPATYREVKLIMEIIDDFKQDLLDDIQGPSDARTIYDPRGNTAAYTTEACIREYRIDACRASLGWGEFLKSDEQLSFFHRSYKANMIETDPEKARTMGFLPPLTPAVPEYRPANRGYGDVAYCEWEQEEFRDTVLDLLLKIAVWLGLTRNAPAVMIFCDVARAFTLKRPPSNAHKDRISLLYSFAMLRIADETVTPGIATPESDDADRSPWNDNNPRFLTDVNNQLNLDFHGVRATGTPWLPQPELNDFFDISTYNPGPFASVTVPYQLDHSRVLRGRAQTYQRRNVLNDLFERTIGRTFSSKPIPKLPEATNEYVKPAEETEEEHPAAVPASQPVLIP